MSMKPSRALVVGLTVLWLVLQGLSYASHWARQAKSPQGHPPGVPTGSAQASNDPVTVVDRQLQISLAWTTLPAPKFLRINVPEVQTAMVQSALSDYETVGAPSGAQLLRLAVLRAATGDRRGALQALHRIPSGVVAPIVVRTLEGLYRIPAEAVPGGDALLKQTFTGWYAATTLTDYYRIARQPARAEELLKTAAKENRPAATQLLVLYAALFLFFLCGVMVLAAIPLWRNKWSPSSFCALPSFWLGWSLFLGYEFTSAFVGIGLGQLAWTPPPAFLLLVQVAVYSVVLWVVGKELAARGVSFSRIGLRAPRPGRLIALGLLGYAAIVPLLAGIDAWIQAVFGQSVQSENRIFELFSPELLRGNWPLVFLLFCVAAPLFEEIMFRGILYGAFRSKLGPLAATAVAAGLFAVVHVDPPAILQLAVLGAAMCYLYEKTGSLVPGMVLHACQNVSTTLLLWILYK